MLRAICLTPLFLGCSLSAWAANPNGTYTATAYSQSGTTASGVHTERHIVAADPDVLPIGSRIKIKHAGRYSGEYVVADTGRKIEGRRLDIYMPQTEACLKFGKKPVRVRVIRLGDGTKQATAQAQHEVKQDVQNEIAKKAVGGAATEDDWATKKHAEAAAPAERSSQTNGAQPAASPAPAQAGSK